MGSSGNNPLASFLVKRRWILVALTAAISVVSAILIPRVRINADVTTYLPDDSPMRRGLSIVAEHLPSLDIRRQTIRLVFPSAEPSDSLQAAVEGLLEDPQLPDIRSGEWEAGSAAYYQYSLPRDTDGARVKAAFRERFGDRVIVEIEDNTGMPEGVPRMITIGFILIFLILVVMCPSFVEALLFMFTIGIAILINMGTNALLPSVSMITNALSTVLQMALSLDYAIILSNRYRQARSEGISSSLAAMTTAVARALPSVLASALTTIASLLMLCFMRLRFGMDLGVVLSKGVLCSLLCTFTLLPALLMALDKAVTRTSKRVPLIPTDGIARFEHRFRLPLALVFLALFAGSYFLQRRVPVYYSMTRATDITRAFPPKNTMLLIYPTEEEQALLPMMDSLGIVPDAVPGTVAPAPESVDFAPESEGQGTKTAPNVRCPLLEAGAKNKNGPKCALPPTSSSSGSFRSGGEPMSSTGSAVTCLSYPAIALTPRTAGEWRAMYPAMMAEVPEEALGLLFYAATHPERDERFALSALRMPPGSGKSLDIAGLMEADGRDTPGYDGKDRSGHGDNATSGHDGGKDMTVSDVGPVDTLSSSQGQSTSFQGSSLESPGGGEISPRGTSSLGRDDREGASSSLGRDDSEGEATGTLPSFQGSSQESLPYTYEGLHQQRTIAGMHQYLGVEMRALRIIYRMERPRQSLETATMSAVETMDAVNKKILSNQVYAAMIPKDKAAALRQMKRDFDTVLAAGPTASDGRDKPGHDGKDAPGNDGKATASHDIKEDVTDQAREEVQGTLSSSQGQSPSSRGSSLESPAGGEISPRGTLSLGRDESEGASSSLGRDDRDVALQVRENSGKEDLAILALSGKKCTAERCYKALHRAGVAVSREEIDLLYLYNGYLAAADTTQRLSLVEMLSCLDSLSASPLAASFIDSTRRAELTGLRGQLDEQLGLLRNGQWSAAVLQSNLPEEGGETYAFIGELRRRCAETFKGETYLAGYSVMYDEMKDSFPWELLLVTLLTALVIFLIVAITFRRPLIAFILVAVVMTAVWLDVFLSGLGGKPVLFMAYFIVQSILMGATIDYSILLTHYYRESRRSQDIATSLRAAYRGSIHTIMTSGLIITLGTWAMTFVISDPVIVPVLRSIASGSLIAIILILFVLPALLTLLDRHVR